MRVIVSAGGTGGHIYPALSIISSLSKEDEVLYIGTSNRMEKDIVPSKNIRFIGIDIEGLNRKNIFKNIVVLYKYFKAYFQIKKIIKDFKADKVIGCGGYITLPVLKAAQSLKIDTYIHEQNSIVGLSNRLVEKKCKKIFISFEDSRKYFKNKNVYLTGNPCSENARDIKLVTKKDLGFDEKELILIVMGSLGSDTISDKLVKLTEKFKNMPYNFLIISGKNYINKFKNNYKNIKVLEYLDNLPGVMKSSDLMVTRSGATTLSEISSLNVLSILVPSPYVTNNHQEKNALTFASSNASILLKEKDFEKVDEVIDEILKDKERIKKIKENLTKFYIADSSKNIVKLIKE